MQHNKYRGRLTVIFVVLFVGLLGIFWPPTRLFDFSTPFSKKLNLKPGIDIKGGVKLVYNIKGQTVAGSSQSIAEQVATALKKRVDPNGVLNLVWRPQGSTLEIWMPLGDNVEQVRKAREAFSSAQEKLDSFNITVGRVNDAMEMKDPAARQKALDELSFGSPMRAEILKKMADAHDRVAAARARLNDTNKDVRDKAQREIEDIIHRELRRKTGTDNLGNPIESGLEIDLEKTNLYSTRILSTILDQYKGTIEKARNEKKTKLVEEQLAKRNEQLEGVRKATTDLPQRLAALDDFVKSYDRLADIRGTSIDDAEGLKRMLRGSGVLEFHILYDPVSAVEAATDAAIASDMVARLPKEGPLAGGKENRLRWFEIDQNEEASKMGNLVKDWGGKKWVLCYVSPEQSMTHKPGEADWGLARATRQQDPSSGAGMVSFEFDPRGGRLFGELSGANIHRRLAIVLDNKLISAPTLQSRIEDRGQITGDFSDAELTYLIRTLNAGSLPARLDDEPIREQIVSSTYGAENLQDGFRSCIIGLIVVAVFLFGYYYLSGAVAMVAVVMNMVIILGVLALFNATFTLPGIAGVILTLGSAVDANVLIFERLREEQHRGLSLRMALRNAYDRAFSAILDSNMITIITSAVLYWVGTEEVKGFGLTLLIGIGSSLFTALFVTRVIFDMMLERYNLQKFGSLPMTFPKWDAMLKPNIKWMSLVPIFLAISAVLMSVGLYTFVEQGRNMYDIEFVKGTSVVFDLKEPMAHADVTRLIAKYEKDLPSTQVIAIGNTNTEYQIDTPNDNGQEVSAAIMAAMGDRISSRRPSTFSGSELADPRDKSLGYEKAEEKGIILKADKAAAQAMPWAKEAILRNENGVIIHLMNITPALSGREIQDRIKQYSEATRVQVAVPTGKLDDTTAEAMVLLPTDPEIARDQQSNRWRYELAEPLWKGVVQAINRQTTFKSINNFPATVANTMKIAALEALVLSIIGILIYIWLRFGNFKYGIANVVAMLHDVLIVLGLIGISHFLSRSWFGQHVLLMEPFRINLTIVAAVLTVMGYSMLDTIVVFDRIRENRGKFGYVSRGIINDSVNQTLSRTLLTCSTTLVTVFIMYVFGGPSIHGFTFVLLGGILVGTYSSIAIASPILLLSGKDVKKDSVGVKPEQKPAVGQLSRATR